MNRVAITQNQFVLVDDADYAEVSKYKWHFRPYKDSGYAARTIRRNGKKTEQYLHHFLTGLSYVDHVNHNGLDNQRSNLRAANHATNQQNTRKRSNCGSRYKGVAWHKKNSRWTAQIRIDKKLVYLGSYSDEKTAAKVYDDAARKHFGNFAHTNFPAVAHVS